jgi:transketolase
VPKCSLEVGITQPWRGIVGDGGLTIGHDGFGYSAPAKVIQKELGLDPESVAKRIRAWLS